MLGGASKKTSTQHVGVMDGVLLVGEIAQTVASVGPFARDLEDPLTGALRNTQEPLLSGNLECFEVGVTDQARPHNNWIVLGVRTPARDKIIMIAPAVMSEARHSVRIKPLQTKNRLLKV